MFTLLCAISIQILKFFCKDRRLLLYMSRTLHLFGTDWCAMMVPIQVIRWYRMQCYDGTDSCATVVPIRRYCQWEDKVVKALKLSGDKDWLIEECKKRFIVSGYRIKYYEALKEVIDRNEWPAFFDELWKMPDWEHDYEDAEAKILIKEERLDLLKDMFEHKHWNLWELYPEYIKYVPKQDHAFVGEILFKDIKRLALLKEKPKEFNWLLGQIERVMRKSAVVDKIIKNGIRQLIADYPDKYYFKSYLGSIL